MGELFGRKKIWMFIFVVFIILCGLIIIFNFLQKKLQSQTEAPMVTVLPELTFEKPTPYYPTITASLLIQSKRNIPTYSPDNGQGVDIGSPTVQTSITEIEKLYPYLPYLKDYQPSTGFTVSIVIPEKELQESPWTLMVQIFGIDYNVPDNTEEYLRMKTSFLETANFIFEWMKSYGVDPEKIFISWGDRILIQDRAEQWLRQ